MTPRERADVATRDLLALTVVLEPMTVGESLRVAYATQAAALHNNLPVFQRDSLPIVESVNAIMGVHRMRLCGVVDGKLVFAPC